MSTDTGDEILELQHSRIYLYLFNPTAINLTICFIADIRLLHRLTVGSFVFLFVPS